jgi:glycosyltransferase involved in cell wall biosynthesis
MKDAVRIALDVHSKNPVSLTTAQDPFACAIACNRFKKKTGVPFVVNIVSSFFDDPFWKSENWKNPFLNILGKRLIHKADGVRVECEIERQKCISLGIAPEKVKVAPVLVNLKKFMDEKESVRDKYLGDHDRIVLFIGRLSVEKNVGYLIDAAHIVTEKRPKTLFMIIGGGAQEALLKEKAGTNPHILFTGRVPHTEIPRYHKAADLFVLPSFYEGIPLVVVEASAAGLPVICTDIRDAPDVIEDGKTGYIVPKGQPDVLAEKIISVLEDPARHEMGKRGQALVMKQFDPEMNLKQCIELWKQVANH